jgi:hypothetical protein
MWKKMKILIIIFIFSVALNTAFAAVWATRRLPAHLGCAGCKTTPHGKDYVSCSFHRKIGTSGKQWREIEPRLIEFKRSCQPICRKAKQLRMELINLIAAPQTDMEAIRSKQDEILASQRQIQELLISHLLEEKEMLTPQQQKAFFKMIQKQGNCAVSSSIMNINSNNISQAEQNQGDNKNQKQKEVMPHK